MEGAESNNGCTKCLFSCTNCCIRVFDRYIRYINRHAYWYCALTSESYCQSAFNSYILKLKSATKIGRIERETGCLLRVAKLFIASLTTMLTYFIFSSMVKLDSYSPLIVIFIIAYLISKIFIEIYGTGANAIF